MWEVSSEILAVVAGVSCGGVHAVFVLSCPAVSNSL